MNFYHGHKYLDLSKNLFQKILIQNCKKFPIKTIDYQNKDEAQLQTEIITLVDQLLKLNEEKTEARIQSKISHLDGKIEFCEDRINEIVNKLYGLEQPEIDLIKS